MYDLNFFEKIKDGVVLSSDALNDNYSFRAIKNQDVGINVNPGDCVYFNSDNSTWLTSSNRIPQGVYAGSGVIVIGGFLNVFSGLTPSSFYYMRSDGSLTTSPILSFNRVKVGYSMSSSTMFIDIDVVGSLQ